MKIAFFTEMNFIGKIPRTHPNMRTEFAWMCSLEADHYPINNLNAVSQTYDLGILIIPKKKIEIDYTLASFRTKCRRVGVMQEGPNWYWQDYNVVDQIDHFNTLVYADFILTHNEIDKKYYTGLTDTKRIEVMNSLMIEDSLQNLPTVERKGVIIGGNFTSWYNGFDSFIIGQLLSDRDTHPFVSAPSMGRRQSQEELLVKHLPYMSNWTEWMYSLNNFKYAVHLMRTHAAGTFALNCAYLGIPCIGYRGLDTQETCHPNLSVEVGDLKTARQLTTMLKDPSFYLEQSRIAKENYKNVYSEQKFLSKFNNIIQNIQG